MRSASDYPGVTTACNYLIFNQLFRDLLIISLASSYAIASKPLSSIEGWPETALVWETARPYLYVRTTADGRAIVGGADEKFYSPELRDLLISKKCRQLQYGFQELFPDIHLEMEYCWAGTFGETKDSLPYFGKIMAHPNTLFNLSYGANGIIFSVIGAEIMRDMVLGRKNPDAKIFDLER